MSFYDSYRGALATFGNIENKFCHVFRILLLSWYDAFSIKNKKNHLLEPVCINLSSCGVSIIFSPRPSSAFHF